MKVGSTCFVESCLVEMYDPETKEVSKQWKHNTSLPPRKPFKRWNSRFQSNLSNSTIVAC